MHNRNLKFFTFFALALPFVFAAPAASQTPDKPAAQVTKSETTSVGNWLLTCNDYINASVKRACTAKLQIVSGDGKGVAFVWEIGLANDKKIISIMHFPTGVLIEPGVELRVGKGQARKIAFTACAPAECTVQFPADSTFIKDVAANQSIEAVIHAVNGATPTFTINPAGIDKAFAQIGN